MHMLVKSGKSVSTPSNLWSSKVCLPAVGYFSIRVQESVPLPNPATSAPLNLKASLKVQGLMS